MNALERLKEMLDQGKITPEDYELLRASLPPENEPPPVPLSEMESETPPMEPPHTFGPTPSAPSCTRAASTPGSGAAGGTVGDFGPVSTASGAGFWGKIKSAPWPVWFAVMLWIFRCGVAILVGYHDPTIWFVSPAKALLAVGLLTRWKPAYVATLILASCSALYYSVRYCIALNYMAQQHISAWPGFPVLTLTSLAVVLTLAAVRKYYFPPARIVQSGPQVRTS